MGNTRNFIQQTLFHSKLGRVILELGMMLMLFLSGEDSVAWARGRNSHIKGDLELMVETRKSFEPEMVDIPAGSFEISSPDKETGGYDGERSVHILQIGAFRMSKYEITNAQFRKFQPEHDSGDYEGHSLNRDKQPVVNVSWKDTVAYTQWLSQQTGKNYRLPTEVEWEYAALAGASTSRHWGEDAIQACQYANVANATVKSKRSMHNCMDGNIISAPVGSHTANRWGLHDMLGNVWERNPGAMSDVVDGEPFGSESGLLRGCLWNNVPIVCRPAFRYYDINLGSYLGFRVVADVTVLPP